MRKEKLKILIVAHPNFKDAMELISSKIDKYDFKVISFKDKIWNSKNKFGKTKLVRKFDIIHFFWGYARIFNFLYYRFLSNTKIINHFMGTDLYKLMNKSPRKRMELRLCSYLSKFRVVVKILHNELNEMNIKNKIVYIMNKELTPKKYKFPTAKKAIAYMPSSRQKFFQRNLLLKLAKDFPEVDFSWFPYKKESDEKLPKNVNCFEYIQKEKVIPTMQKNKVFLRLPIHDGGAPLTLMEALSVGCWAIWTYPFDYVNHAEDYSQLKKKFKTLIEKETANKKGKKYILEHYSLDKIVSGFEQLYSEYQK